MKLASVASMMSSELHEVDRETTADVVEIGILLPAKWAIDLIEMARSRQESVGQMVRRLIDRELAGADAAN